MHHFGKRYFGSQLYTEFYIDYFFQMLLELFAMRFAKILVIFRERFISNIFIFIWFINLIKKIETLEYDLFFSSNNI